MAKAIFRMPEGTLPEELGHYYGELARLHDAGALRNAQYKDACLLAAAVLDPFYALYKRVGDNIILHMLATPNDVKTCREKGHVMSEWEVLREEDGVEPMANSWSSEIRFCRTKYPGKQSGETIYGCGLYTLRGLTRAGRLNGRRRGSYRTGYVIEGASGQRSVSQEDFRVVASMLELASMIHSAQGRLDKRAARKAEESHPTSTVHPDAIEVSVADDDYPPLRALPGGKDRKNDRRSA